eukprot:CAMPEP_0202455270 /NCGR_PEP_ID=MMETSP1360-20130828/12839_1 /ASSEMBLY_ACC=CAM_ASM_000848 /TAXON_ID=515479 /ORGANISM="Licmophora paradoxa, Strain CCMP2313" /LENGTH=399 /DNA_ID=CAMNT_0049074811 /DNA_START=140 /DNA_END=1339 /DNA_ORIENTATION=+
MQQPKEKQLRENVERGFKEWGLKRYNEDERAFIETFLGAVILASKERVSETYRGLFDCNVSSEFPTNLTLAIKHVLREDLKDVTSRETFEDLHDEIGIAWPPYEARTSFGTVSYNISHGYNRRQATLSPFERFRLIAITHKRHLYNAWTNEHILGGTVLEALIAHYVINSKSCYHCKSRSGLRWNGGRSSDASWTDLLCCNCHSTYEVKSKKDLPAVEKIFRNLQRYASGFPGGSFRRFHSNFMGRDHGKRYVVLVTRTPTTKGFFPVYISEIDSVDPSLEGKSFATYSAKRTIFIGSKIKMKRCHSKSIWCQVPCPPHLSTRKQELAKEIYDEEFGNGSWDAEAAKVDAAEKRPATTIAPKTTTATQPDLVAVLKEELGQLELHDRNWDSSSDEDEAE